MHFGGNTTCYLLEAGPFFFIFDMGSGALVAGDYLMSKGHIGKEFIQLGTHFHWDHLQGGPFAVPVYLALNTFHIHGPVPSGYEDPKGFPRTAVESVLSSHQANPFFPVAHECLPAKKTYHGHDRQFPDEFWYFYDDGKVIFAKTLGDAPDNYQDKIHIQTIPLHHPDGCLGYRINYKGASLAFCTDVEPLRYPNHQILKRATGVQWLLMDGQYKEEEIAGLVQGFGHGTPLSCIEQVKAILDGQEGMGLQPQLVISHHDPRRCDYDLAIMEKEAKEDAEELGLDPDLVTFAREGAVWEIPETE